MADRKRRRPPLARDPEQAAKMSGYLATWTGTCPRCDREVHGSQVVKTSHGDWIHTGCASGADD